MSARLIQADKRNVQDWRDVGRLERYAILAIFFGIGFDVGHPVEFLCGEEQAAFLLQSP